VGFYAKHVLPRLIDLAMRHPLARERRAALVPQARGEVLEIGIGSGLNLPFYSSAVTRLRGIDPSAELLAIAGSKLDVAGFPVELLLEGAERLSVSDASVDTVLTTWTLCSIPDPARALAEMRRVLRPGGRLLFVEHGSAPDAAVRRWQRRLDPAWTRLAGGCHLDRRIDELIRSSGFGMERLQARYLPGPRALTFTYEGSATR
jgi:ubiquinone/menaquinone biosynthesis C-methylase UbiE